MKKIIFILIITIMAMLSTKIEAKAGSEISIFVNKSYHLLFVVKNNEITQTIPITIGKGGENETPVGTFKITSIVHNPKWYFNGKVYLPYLQDPENGLGVCWMGLSLPSYGIHGTNEPFSPGRNRSHGCVRMNNKDILKLSAESYIGETVKIENGNKNEISELLKPINLLYDAENIIENSK